MDRRNTVAIVVISLAGGVFALPAGAASSAVAPTAGGQAQFGGEVSAAGEANQFFGFVFAGDDAPQASTPSGQAAVFAAPSHNSLWMSGNPVFLGSDGLGQHAMRVAGLDSMSDPVDAAPPQWTAVSGPIVHAGGDGGMQNPLVVPLPAPVALAGFGLLGMAGIVSTRGRRRR